MYNIWMHRKITRIVQETKIPINTNILIYEIIRGQVITYKFTLYDVDKICSHLWKGLMKSIHEVSVNSVYVTLHAEDVQGPTANVVTFHSFPLYTVLLVNLMWFLIAFNSFIISLYVCQSSCCWWWLFLPPYNNNSNLKKKREVFIICSKHKRIVL